MKDELLLTASTILIVSIIVGIVSICCNKHKRREQYWENKQHKDEAIRFFYKLVFFI